MERATAHVARFTPTFRLCYASPNS
jgi:hypothetical protein